jgi:hypothetical protein
MLRFGFSQDRHPAQRGLSVMPAQAGIRFFFWIPDQVRDDGDGI